MASYKTKYLASINNNNGQIDGAGNKGLLYVGESLPLLNS